MNTRFVAGGVSGVSLLFALFFLKESNPVILAKQRGEKVEQKKEEKKPKVKVHITLTMILCFIYEFCVRWDLNTFNSRYGIYMSDKFGMSSSVFSYAFDSLFTPRTLLVVDSAFNLFIQIVLYPLVVTKLGVPIPWVSFIGMLVNACGFLLMTVNTDIVAYAALFVFWAGYCFGSPTAPSILSVVVC